MRELPKSVEMTTFHRPPDLVQASEILRGGVKSKAAKPLAEAARPIVEDMNMPPPAKAFPSSAGELSADRLMGIMQAVGKVGEFVAPSAARETSAADFDDAKKTLDSELKQIKDKYRSEIDENKGLLDEARKEIESSLTGKDESVMNHFTGLFDKFSSLGTAGRAIAMIGTVALLGFAGSAAILNAPWFGVAAIAFGLLGAFGGVGLEAFKNKFPERFKKMTAVLPQSVQDYLAPKKEVKAVSEESLSKKKDAKGSLKRAASDLTEQKGQLKEARAELTKLKDSIVQALNTSELPEETMSRLISDLAAKPTDNTNLSPELQGFMGRARKVSEASADGKKESPKLLVAELRKSLNGQLQGAIDSLKQHGKDLDALIAEAQGGTSKSASRPIRS